MHMHVFTLSDMVSAAAEGLRSVDGVEAVVNSLGLGTAAGWGGAPVTAEALATAEDLGLIMGGEAATDALPAV